jgi:thymidylate synthase (FAD)
MTLPAFQSEVFRTARGTPYLKSAGVVMIGYTKFDLSGARPFLAGFGDELRFEDYLDDPVTLQDAEALMKFCGQLCYLSLGQKRSWNKDAATYFRNIKESKHGSVLEHASFNFLIYGADRAFTHELVRHRSGVAYSQVSQRYVDGSVLRFVERREYQSDPELHARFETWIDLARAEYNERATILMARQQEGLEVLQGEKARDLRKKVNQAARSCLPNEVEAPICFTANLRALRHIVEMRADKPADIAIRDVAFKLYLCAEQMSSNLFSDYERVNLPDGVPAVTTPYRKV